MRLVALIGFASLLACGNTPPLVTRPSIAMGDAGPYPDDDVAGAAAGEPCALAARRLWSCGCKHQLAHVNNEAFPSFCRDMAPAIDADCIAATVCSDLPTKCHSPCSP